MTKIKELPKSSSHLLQCTQIITSIHCVVKELIENAIDSSSKSIEIKLVDYGLEKIEVKDCGSGICKEDVDKVCKPHCTSKITSHADLSHIHTYGFRGEALAALCAVSDLTITTKTAEEDFGYTYSFGKNGEILSAKPYPCTQGTTITAANLFKTIPVRKQYYRTDKNKKEELKKVEDILYAFACIQTDIRFSFIHNKNLIWQKPVVSKVKQGLVSVFGSSVVDHMQNCEFFDDVKRVKIEVFLPRENAPLFCSQTSSNRTIISINKRPVRMKNIDKVLKQCFSKSTAQLSKSRYPICYISIEVPPSEADVNVEPNKTAVVLHNIDTVLEQLTAILKSFYADTDENNTGKKSIEPDCINNAQMVTHELPMKKSDIGIVSNQVSSLLPDLKLPKNKDKCVERRNSKPSSVQEPAVKRIRMSSSSSNDLEKHIRTMDSFFTSVSSLGVNSDKANNAVPSNHGVRSDAVSLHSNNKQITLNSTESITDSTTELNTSHILSISSFIINAPSNDDDSLMTLIDNNQLDSLNTSSHLLHSKTNEAVKNSTVELPSAVSGATLSANPLHHRVNDYHPSNVDNCFSSVTVDRSKLSSFEVSNEGAVTKNIVSSDVAMNNNSMPGDIRNASPTANLNFDLLFDLDDLNSEQLNHPHEKMPIEINNRVVDSSKKDLNFQTAKSIFEENQVNMITNQQKSCVKENTSNPALPMPKSAEQGSNDILHDRAKVSDWSRGKHPVQNLQPVAVLVPKAKEKPNSIDQEENVFRDKTNNPKEPTVTPLNQRKMTSFDYFCRKHRLEIASINPEMNNHQIAQVLTEKWKNLPIAEKAVYENMTDKAYPKNVKNKEKLGSVVKQNLSKVKGTPVKRKSKVKKKFVERTITLSLKCNEDLNLSDHDPKEINVISCIAPGIWIYSQENKISIVNTFRLQEILIYHRLLKTFRFEPEPLQFPCIVSNDTLGDEAVAYISELPRKIYGSTETVADDRIIANGFEINILKSKNEGDVQLQVVGMTKCIAFYGVLDLKEIVLLLKRKDPGANLSDSRPGKVILYLQSEAVRIARQYPPSKSIDSVKDLMESMKSLPQDCSLCLHSKPYIQEITTLS